MKHLLPILCLFVFSCEKESDAIINDAKKKSDAIIMDAKIEAGSIKAMAKARESIKLLKARQDTSKSP